MGLLSEDRASEGLAANMSLAGNLTLSRLPAFFRPATQAQSVRALVDRMGIRSTGTRQAIAQLSGGNQQKVALGRLLHHDVDLLLLDEPTRGIDIASKLQIYRIVDELALSGKAVLLVSSYLPELLGISDRLAVMHRGTLGQSRPTEAWDEHGLLLEATGQGAD